MPEPSKFLIIQTASIGDAILVTPVIETIRQNKPDAIIHILIRKGNEELFLGHPKIGKVFTWCKKKDKYNNLARLIKEIRREKYDMVINAQRFFSTGLVTILSGAGITAGFDKNPLSRFFTIKAPHVINDASYHEVDRNLALLSPVFGQLARSVRLYPSEEDLQSVEQYKTTPYICIAPASLWFTKQYPEEKWIDFIKTVDKKYTIILVGSVSDYEICERIAYNSGRTGIVNLAGKLRLLQTAALFMGARMVYVNDSAAQHLATAVNAPVTTVFCSTVADFGFGPLSDDSCVVETHEKLSCRPCGLHGYRQCPEKHFRCAYTIDTQELTMRIHDE